LIPIFEIFAGGAIKVLLTGIVTVILPFVIKSVVLWFYSGGLTFLQEFLADLNLQLPSVAYNFTGISAYLMHHLRFIECINVLFAASLTRFTFRFIPFFHK